ncbi:hypothetical protein SAMN04489708_1076 [Paracidovorax cattleyae]|uniref:Uncharacterized protein n=2 Tax=Paracidovorax cattleyae TaxID=80868 RepID=A0A1H0PPH7_9BURK|nr:hypothetical protein C8240_10910 [Paracidovorax cattleyae]SDP07061.1 hypothetical protein SAMN04489708_1076 [Paracidovorax cattleyae]
MIRRCMHARNPSGARRMHARAFALWMWLAVALVLAPALGRVHQVVHGPVAAMALQGAGAAVAGGARLAPLSHGHDAGLLEALFSHHADSDCHLLDQSLFGAVLLPALLPAAMPAEAPAPDGLPAPGVGARPQRAFLARAPPHSCAA